MSIPVVLDNDIPSSIQNPGLVVRRFSAYLIDWFVLTIFGAVALTVFCFRPILFFSILNLLALITVVPPPIGGALFQYCLQATNYCSEFLRGASFFGWAPLLLSCVYYTLMESSQYQATLGKSLCKLKVVDYSGQRVTIARAFVRYCVKNCGAVFFLFGFITSSLDCVIRFGIGFLCFFFVTAAILVTDRKQGVYDFIAKTCVVLKNGEI